MAEHLDGVSHDAVSDDLQRAHHTAQTIWESTQPMLSDSPDAYLILDDSVHDKRSTIAPMYSACSGIKRWP